MTQQYRIATNDYFVKQVFGLLGQRGLVTKFPQVGKTKIYVLSLEILFDGLSSKGMPMYKVTLPGITPERATPISKRIYNGTLNLGIIVLHGQDFDLDVFKLLFACKRLTDKHLPPEGKKFEGALYIEVSQHTKGTLTVKFVKKPEDKEKKIRGMFENLIAPKKPKNPFEGIFTGAGFNWGNIEWGDFDLDGYEGLFDD